MRNPVLASLLVVATGLTSTVAAQDSADVVQANALVTILVENGVLYGISPEMVLRHDLIAGDAEIRYRDGEVVERWQNLSSDPAMTKGLTDLRVVAFGANPGDPDTIAAGAGCAGARATLTAAINAVARACGGGGSGSSACSAAWNFYYTAELDFRECMLK